MKVMISIKDLFAEAVKKLWIVILCMVVCCVAVTALRYNKDKKEADAANNMGTISDVQTELSDDQLAKVYNYVGRVEQYRQQTDYMENSIWLNIDATSVQSAALQYYVKASTEEQAYDVAMAFYNYLNNGGFLSEVAEERNTKSGFMRELFVFDTATYGTFNASNVIGIRITEGTESGRDRLVDLTKEKILAFSESLKASGVSHEILLVQDTKFTNIDNNMAKTKADYYNNHITLGDTIKTLEGELSAEQKDAAETMLNTKPEEDGKEPEPAPVVKKTARISKKAVVLGLALGLILSVGLIWLVYILNGRIKGADEIKKAYDIRALAVVPNKKKNVFAKLADKLFGASTVLSKEASLELLESRILAVCEDEAVTEVVLTGNYGEAAKKDLEDICERLNKKQIHAIRTEGVCNSAESFRLLHETKNVILVETLYASRYSEVTQEMSLCREQAVNVLGYVVFEA